MGLFDGFDSTFGGQTNSTGVTRKIDFSPSGARGPLAPLYENKYQQIYLQFPSNVDAAEENHWVRFDVKAFHGAPLREDQSRDLLTQKNQKDSTFLSRIVRNTAEKGSALVGAAASVPGGILKSTARELLNDLPPGLGNLLGKNLFKRNKNREQSLSTILLYAPHIRQDTFKANWQNQETHLSGAALMAAGGQISMGALKNAINRNNETLNDMVTSRGSIIENLKGLLLGSALGNNTLNDIALRSKGVAFNNHLEIFFQSVDFRTFNFEFKLAPRNSHEARSIRDIIQTFKYAAAPSQLSGQFGVFFEYPNVFEIEFFNEKQTHKIATSVLTSVSVDHSGAGVNSTFYDNYPLETNLNLTFTELEIMHKEKIDQGY